MTALVLEPETTAEEIFARAGLLVPVGGCRGEDRVPTARRPVQTVPTARLVALPPAAAPLDADGPAHAVPPSLGRRLRILRASDRSPVLDAADEDRGASPQGDVAALAGLIAQATVEVLGGRRSPGQLARWVTPGVYETVHQRAALTVRVLGPHGPSRPPAVRRVRVCAIDAHVREASVVIEDGSHVRAVALRIESHRGAWRATAVEVG
ncbi:Rv3235 family protein [Cellulomonas sp. URHB0016]